MAPLVPTSRSNQAEGFPTAPQENVKQTNHKYVTKQCPPSPTQPTQCIPERRD